MEVKIDFDNAEDLEFATVEELLELSREDPTDLSYLWVLDIDTRKMWYAGGPNDTFREEDYYSDYYVTHTIHNGVLTFHPNRGAYVSDFI